MSLAQTQQIYELLVRIDSILSGIQIKVQDIEHGGGAAQTSSMRDVLSQARQLERVAVRCLAILESTGLKNDTLAKISRVIVALRMMQIALMQVYALSGPIGWAFLLQATAAGASVTMAGMTMNDIGQM